MTPGAAGDLNETTAWKNEKNIEAELKQNFRADDAELKQNFRADRGHPKATTKAKKKNVNKSAITDQEENETQQSDNYEVVRHKKKKMRNSAKAVDQKIEENKSQ